MTNELRPISFSGGLKSISDDDLCASCKGCIYRPGENSGCKQGWPGMEDSNGYVQECIAYVAAGTVDVQQAKCQNCELLIDIDQLEEITDMSQRVSAGETVPAGQCPSCGCLCHLVAQAKSHAGVIDFNGPWTLADALNDQSVPVLDADGCMVAAVFPALYHANGRTEDKRDVNAQLLLRAPVMYVAIKNMLACLAAGDMDSLANAAGDAQAIVDALESKLIG